MPATPVPARQATSAGRLAPLLIGGATLAATFATMAGWLLQEPRLIVSLNGRMVFNFALCFGLAALVLMLNPVRSALRDPLRATAGAVIALVSAATLLEHLADWDTGIDWTALHANLGETGLHPGCNNYQVYDEKTKDERRKTKDESRKEESDAA